LRDVVWDRYYHVILASDAVLRGLLRRLDLDREVVWRKTRTGAFVNGRLYGASGGIEFLRLPSPGFVDKLRIVATMLAASRTSKEALENQTAEQWLRRWSGAGGYERFWEPLLRSKLGEEHRLASASFIGATIERLSSARKNEFGEERFGYVPGGYATIVKRYEERLRDLGVELRASADVREIKRAEGGWEICSANGAERVDRVVVTVPASLAARMCPELHEEERARLTAVRYQGIVCAAALLSRPLSPYYVTNLIDPIFPFTGVIETTALVDPAEFGGSSLVYLPKYVASDDPLFEENDERIRERFLAGLRLMHPGLRDEEIRAFRVSRARRVFAIPTVGYSARLPSMRTSAPGLFTINGAQITGGTLNVNETLALAERGFAVMTEEERSACRS
jgi:protoporphyrinogen oxidase